MDQEGSSSSSSATITTVAEKSHQVSNINIICSTPVTSRPPSHSNSMEGIGAVTMTEPTTTAAVDPLMTPTKRSKKRPSPLKFSSPTPPDFQQMSRLSVSTDGCPRVGSRGLTILSPMTPGGCGIGADGPCFPTEMGNYSGGGNLDNFLSEMTMAYTNVTIRSNNKTIQIPKLVRANATPGIASSPSLFHYGTAGSSENPYVLIALVLCRVLCL